MNKKITIINGSPRKNQNTAKMCEKFAQGAKDHGAEIEIINLYDIDFKGCYSCFACKLRGGKNYGKCAYPDGLKSVIENSNIGREAIRFFLLPPPIKNGKRKKPPDSILWLRENFSNRPKTETIKFGRDVNQHVE